MNHLPSHWAMEKAAQAWCTPATSSKEMDPELAEAFAWILDVTRVNERARIKKIIDTIIRSKSSVNGVEIGRIISAINSDLWE